MTILRIASLAAALLTLAGCAVYEPYPTTYYERSYPAPTYYGPAVVVPPVYGPTIVYRDGYRGYRGPYHRHDGWGHGYGRGYGHHGR